MSVTPGTWAWWTSNSWTRLRSEDCGRTREVLTPVRLRDGQLHIVVTPDDMALIAAAKLMLEMLVKLAAECGECDGNGEVPELDEDGSAVDVARCPSCVDIRAVIALIRETK